VWSTDPLQGTAEPLSQDGGRSGKAYLRKGKTPTPRFVELHEVHMDPLLKPVKVPLDSIPSL